MINIEHDSDSGLADFLAGWSASVGDTDQLATTVTYAVIGLTNFGERPVPTTRLAEVLRRPLNEAEALARQWGWPGTQVENGLITVNPERARSATRRHVQVGNRRFGVTGCAFDALLYAPMVRPSLLLEESCPVTGTPIRIVFASTLVEHVEPVGTVIPLMAPQEVASAGDTAASDGDIEDVDAAVCVQQMSAFASAEAAQGWLDAHPGGWVFPVRQAWDLEFLRDWRARMSALLSLQN